MTNGKRDCGVTGIWPDQCAENGCHRHTIEVDDIRPAGIVERTCAGCGWSSWHDPTSAGATAVPFVCDRCAGEPELMRKGGD